MRVALSLLTIASLTSVLSFAQAPASKTLDIYVVDVEGGNATLFVSPSGESMLIDTGNAGRRGVRSRCRAHHGCRERRRPQKIDHLITTHWHGDHFGGLAELAAHIPIGEYIDHGPNVQPGEARRRVSQEHLSRSSTPKPSTQSSNPATRSRSPGRCARGDFSRSQSSRLRCPAAGKPNPYCADFQDRPRAMLEDPQSISVYVTYGKFRTVHLRRSHRRARNSS